MLPNKEIDGTGKQYFLKGLVPMPSGPHSPLMFGLEAHGLGYWGAFRGKHQRARRLSYSTFVREQRVLDKYVWSAEKTLNGVVLV